MQDKTLAKIGEIYLEKQNFTKPHHVYIENMYPGASYKMIMIHFALKELKSGYSCKYKGINIDDVSEKNYLNYTYREGTSKRAGNVTFTTKVVDVRKRIKNIKTVQLKAVIEKAEKHSDEKEIFSAFRTVFLEKEKNIINDVEDTIKGFDKKDKYGLSISFELNDKVKYLDHFKTIKEMLIHDATEKISESNGIVSEGENQVCSVCQKKSEKLHGFANPLAFYTVNKPGFASNFFNQSASWKNYPICSECSSKVELGLRYIEEKLRRSFWGNPYYLIPRMVYDIGNKHLKKALTALSKYEYNSKDDKIREIEDYFFKYVSKESNYFFIDMLFYEKNNAEFNIKLMLEEIYPSRLRRLFTDIPVKIEKNEIYKAALNRKDGKAKIKKDMEFNFGVLKRFFEEDFYDLIYRVFLGIKIDPDSLYSKFMRAIKKAKNDGLRNGTYYVDEVVLCAIMTMNYFQELEILDYNNKFNFEVKMEHEYKIKSTRSFNIEKLLKFIEENKSFLDENRKIGVFSVGILVKLVMMLQHIRLGSTPFEKKLRGLNISADNIKQIYVDALEKLSQYLSTLAYQELREFIAKYFVLNSSDIKKMSSDEISFYFVAGMELGKSFKGLLPSEGEDGDLSDFDDEL